MVATLMKKENKIFFAIIIGATIIAFSIFQTFNNKPEAILSKKCKAMVKSLKSTDAASEAIIFQKCITGQF